MNLGNRKHVTTLRPGQRVSVSTPWGVYRGVVHTVYPHGVWLVSDAAQSPPIIPLNKAASGTVEPAFFGLMRMLPLLGGGLGRAPAPSSPSADRWAPGPPFTPYPPYQSQSDPSPSDSGGAADAPNDSRGGFLGFLHGRNRFWWVPLAFYGLRLFF